MVVGQVGGQPSRKIGVGYESRVLRQRFNAEKLVLSLLFVLTVIAYGAIGRDILFNRLNVDVVLANKDDFVSRFIPYLRAFSCSALIAVVVLTSDIKWALSKFPWMLSPFLILALTSTAWSDDPKESFEQAILTGLMCWSTTLFIHRVGLHQTSRLVLQMIAWICIVSATLALVAPSIGRHTGLEFSQTSHAGEWRGIFSHKNILGPYAAWGVVLLAAYPRLTGGGSLFIWTARLSACACLVFSNSVTNFFSAMFLVSLQTFFFMLRRWNSAFVFAFSAAVGGAGLLAAVLFKDELFAIFKRDATLTGRDFIWAVDFRYFLMHPILGGGFQRAGGLDLQAYMYAALGQPLATESAYWALLIDLGMVGFVLFYVPYVIAIWNGMEWLKHVTPRDRSALEAQISLLLSSLVIGFTTADMMLSTGLDGVMNFAALFALLTTPKSPQGVLRGEFRLAKFRIDPFRRRRGPGKTGSADLVRQR